MEVSIIEYKSVWIGHGLDENPGHCSKVAIIGGSTDSVKKEPLMD